MSTPCLRKCKCPIRSLGPNLPSRRSIELDFNVVLACFGRPFSTLLRFSSASTHPFPRLRRVRLRSHDHCEISQST